MTQPRLHPDRYFPRSNEGARLHPDSLTTEFARNEYISALHCAIGFMVAQRAQTICKADVEAWSRQITILSQIVWSINGARTTDDLIAEGIDAEADRCSSHIDSSEGGAA